MTKYSVLQLWNILGIRTLVKFTAYRKRNDTAYVLIQFSVFSTGNSCSDLIGSLIGEIVGNSTIMGHNRSHLGSIELWIRAGQNEDIWYLNVVFLVASTDLPSFANRQHFWWRSIHCLGLKMGVKLGVNIARSQMSAPNTSHRFEVSSCS